MASANGPSGKKELQPTIEVVALQHTYKTVAGRSLNLIDFRNFRVHIFDAKTRRPIFSAKLRDGKYESKWTLEKGSDSLRLDWARLIGEKSRFAVILLSWETTGASTSDFGVVQVFTMRNPHPVVVQKILFKERGCGASAKLSNPPVSLTISGVHGWEHCCPKSLDVVTFSWDGLFRLQHHRRVPLPPKC
jgi:hypothetical protein